jgi:2-keto-4-pentenoate hydratase/2-oxohepta-3-ene-1,7-dioic acid hydratase in catechol pathway
MKWCRYKDERRTTFGIVEDDLIWEVDGSPFHEHRRTGRQHHLSSAHLDVPVIPPNFYAMGMNFQKHLDWAAGRFGTSASPPERADMGYRSPNALVPTESPIVIPGDSIGPVQYEGELVAVIGRQAKGLSRTDALNCVFGYTLGNDVSERGWQFKDRTLWRAKNSDTFKPMGPLIETDLDPDHQHISVRVNGETVSAFDTAEAIFDLSTCISRLSRYITLFPGDVIWMGTDGATEPDLKAGDLVEIENAAIGILRNRVERAAVSPGAGD